MTMRDRLAADLYAFTADSPSKPWTNAERHYCYRLADRLIRRDWVRLDEELAEEVAVRLWKVMDDHDCTVDASHVLTIIRALREKA